MFDKMCWPSMKGVKCLPHSLNLLSGYMNASIYISNFLNTNLDMIIAQRDVVNGNGPLQGTMGEKGTM